MSRPHGSWLAFCAAMLLLSLAPEAGAAGISGVGSRQLRPAKRPSLRAGCELPATFYSSTHQPFSNPCCPSAVGVCPGGVACPPTGVCSDGRACLQATPPALKNVILMIPDDLGACHYGHAGECRSVLTGTPVPAPETPNLDLLAGQGSVFPIAHNTSSWCFPSLTSILTGRYQRSFEGQRRPAEAFGTIATSLRALDGTPFLPNDPYQAGNKTGGVCTLLAGKLGSVIGDAGFDVRTRTSERSLGRVQCEAGGPGGRPRCGSELQSHYSPTEIFRMGDVFAFIDSMLYREPGSNPATFRVHPFFVWYAPRIPHQPLRANPAIGTYLFGGPGQYPLGGLFDLGSLCSGGSCAQAVTALTSEYNFGNGDEMFANVWWMDYGLREIRRFLARASEPHCIDRDGKSRFDVSEATCNGTWAADITRRLDENTVIVSLADNGWHVPFSKHNFTENGYRTRLIVFDPTTAPTAPGWDVTQEPIPPARENPALAHAADVRATVVGYALGSPAGIQLCPQGSSGSRCDGKDLRPWLATAAGGPAPPETLRRALCGHETQRTTTAGSRRYLLTGEGAVGRCTNLAAPVCAADADCAASDVCLGDRCMPTAEAACTATSQCPVGAACLGRRCRVAPSCVDDGDCARLFPGGTFACVEKAARWCRNAPGVRCATRDDCPACPGGAPCGRSCEPRRLKFYVAPGDGNRATQMSDLFLDPDEFGLHDGKRNPDAIVTQLSSLAGPYGPAMQGANCCIDDWWPEAASAGTSCAGGCPAELTCNR